MHNSSLTTSHLNHKFALQRASIELMFFIIKHLLRVCEQYVPLILGLILKVIIFKAIFAYSMLYPCQGQGHSLQNLPVYKPAVLAYCPSKPLA